MFSHIGHERTAVEWSAIGHAAAIAAVRQVGADV